MLGKVTPFKTLTIEEKIEFFITCQQKLLEFHPKSEFLLRKDNVNHRLEQFLSLIRKYNGLSYVDANICVLFNRIYVNDPTDPVSALRANLWKGPAEEYNGISIDFVVFRDIKDCMYFCQNQYDPRIEYVLYVREGRPRIFRTVELISHIFKVPKAPVTF